MTRALRRPIHSWSGCADDGQRDSGERHREVPLRDGDQREGGEPAWGIRSQTHSGGTSRLRLGFYSGRSELRLREGKANGRKALFMKRWCACRSPAMRTGSTSTHLSPRDFDESGAPAAPGEARVQHPAADDMARERRGREAPCAKQMHWSRTPKQVKRAPQFATRCSETGFVDIATSIWKAPLRRGPADHRAARVGHAVRGGSCQ